jgi:CheY-like chemotaxis protein
MSMEIHALIPDAPEAESVGDDRRVAPRARVLVVEDEADLRELLGRWLETKGYEVTEAADGEEAIELLEAGVEPDVILLDLTMPRMDGWTFLTWLRGNPRHRDRRVLVASAFARDAPPQDVEGLVAKPFPPELLERELARLTANA